MTCLNVRLYLHAKLDQFWNKGALLSVLYPESICFTSISWTAPWPIYSNITCQAAWVNRENHWRCLKGYPSNWLGTMCAIGLRNSFTHLSRALRRKWLQGFQIRNKTYFTFQVKWGKSSRKKKRVLHQKKKALGLSKWIIILVRVTVLCQARMQLIDFVNPPRIYLYTFDIWLTRWFLHNKSITQIPRHMTIVSCVEASLGSEQSLLQRRSFDAILQYNLCCTLY